MLKSYCTVSMNGKNINVPPGFEKNSVKTPDQNFSPRNRPRRAYSDTLSNSSIPFRTSIPFRKSNKKINPIPESSKILRRFKMNPTAKFSITRPFEADQISTYIITNVTNELHKNPMYCTITDGTAGVGGDVINLCRHFGYVNAVEKDSETYSLLLQNLNEFDVSNVKTYKKDYTSIMHELHQDVLYIDPPWGGVNYKDLDECPLYLSNKEIGLIIYDIFESNPNLLIFLKAPINVKQDSFKKYIMDVVPILNKAEIPSFILIKIKNIN
jgi:16S rRNA G966 N2-methylase RsmD